MVEAIKAKLTGLGEDKEKAKTPQRIHMPKPAPFDQKLRHVYRALAVVLVLTGLLLVAICVAPLEDYYTATGRVLPGDYRRLFAPIRARVDQVLVDEGDTVTAGQPLLTFKLRALDLELEQAREELANLEAQLKYQRTSNESLALLPLPKELWEISDQVAQNEASVVYHEAQLKRLRELGEAGAVSKTEIEQAELQHKQAKIEQDRLNKRYELVSEGYTDSLLSTAKAEASRVATQISGVRQRLERLELDRSEFSKLEAPSDGIILKVVTDQPGEVVEPGQLLVYMATGNSRIVEINGDERNFHKVRVGQAVRFKSELYDTFKYGYAEGHVVKIDPLREHLDDDAPAANSAQGQAFYPIYATIEVEPVQLRLDSTVNAQIVLRQDRLLKVLFGMD